MDPKDWVLRWKQAGEALDSLHAEDLASLTDNDVRCKIALIFEDAPESLYTERATLENSGLVQMRAYFDK
jgi:hypothetical protein